MKKVLYTFIITILCVSAHSSEKGRSGVGVVSGGGKSGHSSEVMLDPEFPDQSVKVDAGKAWQLGFFYHYYYLENVSLNLGAGFSGSEIKFKWDDGSETINLTADYNFFYLDAGARYHFFKGSKYSKNLFFAGAGLYYGIIAGDVEVEGKVKYGSTSVSVKDKISKKYLNNDYGLFLEFGVDYPVRENIKIGAALRYNAGLSKIYEDNNLSGMDDSDGIDDSDVESVSLRNIMLNLSATYYL